VGNVSISLPPNRQSKVPNKQGKVGVSQGHVYKSAQDRAGIGALSKGGIGGATPGKTVREDDCLTQGQDAGSHQARVPSGGMLNVGASGEGKTPIGGDLRAGTKTESQVNAPSATTTYGPVPVPLD